jgi:aldose 1-epimerase
MITLQNNNNVSADFIEIGASLFSLRFPDSKGEIINVCLNHKELSEYKANSSYYGSICGRFSNRIANGKFSLNGKEYSLPINDKIHHLHGGTEGFSRKSWKVIEKEIDKVVFFLKSPSGDQGYPGTVEVYVTYTLKDDNSLSIDYSASADSSTPINLTNHTYFNLNGEGNGDIIDHDLMIEAELCTETDSDLIPTGKLLNIDNARFDFRKIRAIGSVDNGSYDVNFILNDPGNIDKPKAVVISKKSGIRMEVFTTEPALQFYTGVFLDGSTIGESGHPHIKHGGFCLEAQHFPDSPNHPNFPSTILNPGETYKQTTIYKFSNIT